jgi:hypothetical protein
MVSLAYTEPAEAVELPTPSVAPPPTASPAPTVSWERKYRIRHMSRELRRKVVAWVKDSYPPLPRRYLEALSTYKPHLTILEDVVRCELQKCKD